MGCHTWFKTKSKYDVEDCRRMWLIQQEKLIEDWERIVEDPSHPFRLNTQYDHNDLLSVVELMKRQYRMVKNKNIKFAFIRDLEETDEGDLYEYRDGIIYVVKNDAPHDLFRVGDYPETKLFSLEQTLDFIESYEEGRIYKWDSTIPQLKDFWQKNPIGMIEFG